MIKKILYLIFVLSILIACTQFLDEESKLQSTYTGNDGCVYCHTNQDRLKSLAIEEETTSAGGG